MKKIILALLIVSGTAVLSGCGTSCCNSCQTSSCCGVDSCGNWY